MRFLFWIMSGFWVACTQPSGNRDERAVIPQNEMLASDSRLTMQQGLLYLAGKPYSGIVNSRYANGKLATKDSYLNGKLEGKQEKWYENGAIREIRYYTANRKVGKHEGWYQNGQKRFEYFINNDVPVKIHQEWFANGQLFTFNTYNDQGQPEGLQQMWYDNGKIKANYVVKGGRRFGLLGAKGCMGKREIKATQLVIAKE